MGRRSLIEKSDFSIQIEILSSIVLPIVGVALFLPLLREALRLRGTLQTEWRSDTKVDSE